MGVSSVPNANHFQGLGTETTGGGDGRNWGDQDGNGRDGDIKSESKSFKSANTVRPIYGRRLNSLEGIGTIRPYASKSASSSGSRSYKRQYSALSKDTPLRLSALDGKERTTRTQHSQLSQACRKGHSPATSAQLGVSATSGVSEKSERSGKTGTGDGAVVGKQRLEAKMEGRALMRDSLDEIQTRKMRERRERERRMDERRVRKRKGESERGRGEGPAQRRERERRKHKTRERGRKS